MSTEGTPQQHPRLEIVSTPPEALLERPQDIFRPESWIDETELEPGKFRRAANFCGRFAFRGACVALFAVGAVRAFGTTTGSVGPLNLEGRPSFNPSGDAVVNAGAGEVDLNFSDGLYGMDIRLQSVSADAITQVKHITDEAVKHHQDPTKAVLDAYRPAALSLVIESYLKGGGILLGGAAMGGLTAELLLQERKRRHGDPEASLRLRNIAVGPAVLLLAAGLNVATFHDDALAHPMLNRNDALGALVAAGENTFSSLNSYKQNATKINTWFTNFVGLEKNLGAAETAPNNLIPILIMSDVHSKPCTYDRVEALVKAYHAAAVINAGDETEWGYSLEMSVFNSECSDSNPQELSVPEIFVGGNHDSASVIEAMKHFKNVVDLQGKIYKLKLKFGDSETSFLILGNNDPAFLPDSTDPAQAQQWKEEEVALGDSLVETARQQKPDIIVVHEPEAAKRIQDELGPDQKILIVSGHTHMYNLKQDGSDTWLTAPSAGASGLRGFESTESSNVNGYLIAYINPQTKQMEKVSRIFIDNYGRFCSDDIYLENAPPKSLQQLSCDVANPTK